MHVIHDQGLVSNSGPPNFRSINLGLGLGLGSVRVSLWLVKVSLGLVYG